MLGEPQRGLPYLAGNWSAAPPESAGLAGAFLFGQGLLGQALPALQRAVGSEAQPPDGGSGDPSVARAGVAPDPADAEAAGLDPAHLVNLGRCLTLLDRPAEALPLLQRAVAAEAPHPLALKSLAEVHLALEDPEAALAVLPERSANDDLVCARASVLAMAGRHDEAALLLRDTLVERPQSRSLLLLAAELAQVRGRDGEATTLLRAALDHDPGDIALWVQLAQADRRGLREGPGEIALQASERAMELAEALDPPVDRLLALAQVAQAHVLERQGESQAAEERYRQALSVAPMLVPALSGLGQLLLQIGRVEEAVICYEQVRSAAPLQGWSQLIHARQVPEDPAVLEQMEQAARRPSLEGPLRSGLLFTLAAAHDRLGDHGRAIALAAEANAASKARLPYRPEVHRARVEREMAFFTPSFLAARCDWGDPSELPVFVLGMPRSGTTLTEQILASHSQVHGAGELGQIGEQIARMEAWELKLGSGLGYPACLQDLTAAECRRYAAAMLERLQAHAPGAQRIIDKLPHNFEHIGLIRLLFPRARLIHVRREPRDVASSNFFTDYGAKYGGMGFAYDWQWIGEQLVDHDRLMAHWHALLPGQILEVPYEALVEDTETWARRMLEHLGLAWEPGVLEFQDLDRSVKTASVWQVRQPVYTSSMQRWRRYGEALVPLEAVLAEPPPRPPKPWPAAPLPPGLFVEAMALLRQGRLLESEQRFRRLLAARPHHAAAHQFLGGVLLQSGRIPEALEAMRHSIALLPIHPSWWQNLAAAEERAGHVEAAAVARSNAERLRQFLESEEGAAATSP
ncbi:MAG: sulfotransferase [Cyanobium sp.]